MYKLKEEYKGSSTSTGGYVIILDDVKSEQVEKLGLEDYFEKTGGGKAKSKDKNKDIIIRKILSKNFINYSKSFTAPSRSS